MFFISENNEAAENQSAQEKNLSPKEDAIFKLRQICAGLLEDFGTIRMGIALHTFVEKQREVCLRLGYSVHEVGEVIDEYCK